MKCAIDGCVANTVGQSKYCGPHRAESRKRWKEMLGNKSAEKQARETKWEDLWCEADAAGKAAAAALYDSGQLQPMVVQQHANMMDDQSPVVKSYYVPEGPCGFAWVVVRPGNHSFALWCKKHQKARPNYGGGMMVKWVHEYGQSMQLKEAYARAFAEVLRGAGINAYSSSRMD